MNNIFEIKKIYLIIFIISLLSLLIALYIEFFLDYKPCKLCIYQRIPYLIATISSVLGACLGYFIGYVFFNEIGIKIFEFYGVDPTFWKNKVSSEGGVIAWITLLAIAGFSPVPFKLLTISSGFIHFNIAYFIVISLLTRGSRFFLIAFLIGNFGPAMKLLIEKKLLKVSIIASIILIIFAYFVYKFLTIYFI